MQSSVCSTTVQKFRSFGAETKKLASQKRDPFPVGSGVPGRFAS